MAKNKTVLRKAKASSKENKVVVAKTKATSFINPVLMSKVMSISDKPTSIAPMAGLTSVVVLPHKGTDANCMVNLAGRDKTFQPCQKADIDLTTTKVPKAFIEVLAPVMASQLPKGCRAVMQASPYSGGTRVGIGIGKGSSSKFIVSNTGGKLTFQRQGNALSLQALHKHAVSLGVEPTQSNCDASYICYSFYDRVKAMQICQKALDLLTI